MSEDFPAGALFVPAQQRLIQTIEKVFAVAIAHVAIITSTYLALDAKRRILLRQFLEMDFGNLLAPTANINGTNKTALKIPRYKISCPRYYPCP
jgi:hypothetical protein